ncbi:hypothetical protein TSUD_349880 [Trifolium subterraneum]|uniref:DUF4283 domain-containing protein n=1 Tax=Trifolium subterraneum TaxID=3900 RepID=A0A2Z6PDJ4_TRISU|nr:hypothetical protein TSUD_349880 [Trifolium subterraneum]
MGSHPQIAAASTVVIPNTAIFVGQCWLLCVYVAYGFAISYVCSRCAFRLSLDLLDLVFSTMKPFVAPTFVVFNRSFVQALLNKVYVSLTQLPKPCLKGNSFSIKISEEVYQSDLANCNNYLHGRLALPRGDKPLSSKGLCDKLSQLWKPIGQLKMIPLGWRFFESRFT